MFGRDMGQAEREDAWTVAQDHLTTAIADDLP